MSYKIYSRQRLSNSDTALIVPPLVIIMIFCFVLVLVQPHPSLKQPIIAVSKQPASLLSSPSAVLSDLTFTPAEPLSLITQPSQSTISLTAGMATANPQSSTSNANPLQATSSNKSNYPLEKTMETLINQPKTLLAPAFGPATLPGSAEKRER